MHTSIGVMTFTIRVRFEWSGKKSVDYKGATETQIYASRSAFERLWRNGVDIFSHTVTIAMMTSTIPIFPHL